MSRSDLNLTIQTATSNLKTAGFWKCYFLVLGMSLGGLASSLWQLVLNYGLWEGIISTLLVSLGYFTMDLCLAELIGIVPFAGGNYGFVRCALGPYAGFMAGLCEFIFYNFYSARNIMKLAKLITHISQKNIAWELLWGLLIHLLVISCQLSGEKIFWSSILSSTVFMLIVIVIFWCGSFKNANFYKWAYQHNLPRSQWNNGFEGTIDDYMQYADIAAVLFMGLEILPMLSAHVKDEVRTIPKAIMWGWLTMTIISTISIFAVAVHFPGVSITLMEALFPLQYGLSSALHMPTRYTAILLLPATFASSMGFLFAASNQLSAMAESGLVARQLTTKWSSVLFCGLVEYIIYLIFNHYTANDIPALFRMVCIAVFFLHFFLYAAFIAFRVYYPNFERSFVNPCGSLSAVVGTLIFAYMFIGLLFYQDDNHAVPIAFVIFMFLMTVHYYAYVQQNQSFSQEEKEKFFRAYIMNANMKTYHRRRTKHRILTHWETISVSILRPCGLSWIIDRTENSHSHGSSYTLQSGKVSPMSSGESRQKGTLSSSREVSSTAVGGGGNVGTILCSTADAPNINNYNRSNNVVLGDNIEDEKIDDIPHRKPSANYSGREVVPHESDES